ncbi:MAG TPA: hypothetical protein VME24_01125 [Alphaproteobacteria bacterium]|nr:hypothetical protein [Alphaproteobacteria bacterium]
MCAHPRSPPNKAARLHVAPKPPAEAEASDRQSIATNQIGATGTNVFQVVLVPDRTCGFYRVVTP